MRASVAVAQSFSCSVTRGIFPDRESSPALDLLSPALAGGFFPTEPPGKPPTRTLSQTACGCFHRTRIEFSGWNQKLYAPQSWKYVLSGLLQKIFSNVPLGLQHYFFLCMCLIFFPSKCFSIILCYFFLSSTLLQRLHGKLAKPTLTLNCTFLLAKFLKVKCILGKIKNNNFYFSLKLIWVTILTQG